jgi:hypothetical protein
VRLFLIIVIVTQVCLLKYNREYILLISLFSCGKEGLTAPRRRLLIFSEVVFVYAVKSLVLYLMGFVGSV